MRESAPTNCVQALCFTLLTLVLLGPALAAAEQERAVLLIGQVVDSSSGKPIPEVRIHLRQQATRQQVSGPDGHFRISIPAAESVLVCAHRLGYIDAEWPVIFLSGDYGQVTFRMVASPVLLSTIEVPGRTSRFTDPLGSERAVSLSGRLLWESLGQTVATTLSDAPGVALRSMGPAPARPVVRGLGGNRLLVLENGESTGDLSASSADHAVAIDPISSTRISVVRGPASLLFGSNTVGGVVDVQSERIPEALPHHLQGSTTLSGTTGNEEGAGALHLELPLGTIALASELSYRNANSVRTPIGRLSNSGLITSVASLGALTTIRSFTVGASLSRYDSDYGIPGGFLGGHPGGVDIELEREQFDARVAYQLRERAASQLLTTFSSSRYQHRELESSGICGVSYGQQLYSAASRLRLAAGSSTLTIGGSWSHRDLRQGCLSFLPPVDESGAALYVLHQLPISRGTFEWSLRGDVRAIEPTFLPGRSTTTKAGQLRARSFAGLSAGASLSREIHFGTTARLTALLASNYPSAEELFSDGPHLAAYSYEVGNVDLAAERGLAVEVGLERETRSFQASAAVYYHRFFNYIAPINTGQFEYGPGEEGLLVRYQYVGQEAQQYGLELTAGIALHTNWYFESTVEALVGELLEEQQPMPEMPPFGGTVALEWKQSRLKTRATMRWAADQTRLSQFEQPTAGFATFGLVCSWQLPAGRFVHHIELTSENLTDIEYRQHLSRVKSVMPESGRSVIVRYRLYF